MRKTWQLEHMMESLERDAGIILSLAEVLRLQVTAMPSNPCSPFHLTTKPATSQTLSLHTEQKADMNNEEEDRSKLHMLDSRTMIEEEKQQNQQQRMPYSRSCLWASPLTSRFESGLISALHNVLGLVPSLRRIPTSSFRAFVLRRPMTDNFNGTTSAISALHHVRQGYLCLHGFSCW